MHFWLHHTAHRTEKIVVLPCGFCISRKGGTEGSGWGHPHGAVHMVAARLCWKMTMVETGWATSHADCMDRLKKHYSHLVGVWFLARKGYWALSECITTNSADYCMLVTGHGQKATSLIK